MPNAQNRHLGVDGNTVIFGADANDLCAAVALGGESVSRTATAKQAQNLAQRLASATPLTRIGVEVMLQPVGGSGFRVYYRESDG